MTEETNPVPFQKFSLGTIFNNNKETRVNTFEGNSPSANDSYVETLRNINLSWNDCITFKKQKGSIPGLREPQIGAVYAILAHWISSTEPATVVMPTGTGKTETMLTILLSRQCEKLLVIVPNLALRSQLAEKFTTLGVLKKFGVVNDKALYPIVGTLERRPNDIVELNDFFSRCNVIITNIQIAGQCTPDIQKEMAKLCPYLFIDEAHHVAAKTWYSLKSQFGENSILQFTATPFRNDGKLVGGKIIFSYPLRKALDEGYFKRIYFRSVTEFNESKSDEKIAQSAVEQLRSDLVAGFDHILMARVASIPRANQVLKIYQRYSEFNPVQIHSDMASEAEFKAVMQAISDKRTRIVICVDMFGEGFDLPELKIAALHDIKKSLPITLQLVGRFIRDKATTGQPTFIANLGTAEVDEELEDLYSQDADWNTLLINASERFIGKEVAFREFLENFDRKQNDLSIENVRPSASVVIFKTACEEWTPENFLEGLDNIENCEWIDHKLNQSQNTLIIIAARSVPCTWLNGQSAYNLAVELYVIFWDRSKNLLFINNSSNNGVYEKMAVSITDKSTKLIEGDDLFRSLGGIKRLKLQNVGLRNQRGRLIRYTMRAGSDVKAALSELQTRGTTKSLVIGNGFESGKDVSIGCSYKGRVWSHQKVNLLQFTEWCKVIGRKVLDTTISTYEVIRDSLRSTEVFQRPNSMPIGVDWNARLYESSDTLFEFVVDDQITIPFYRAELVLLEPSEEGDIRFRLKLSESFFYDFQFSIFEASEGKNYSFAFLGETSPKVIRGNKKLEDPIIEFLNEFPPTFWFADGSTLEEGNWFIPYSEDYNLFSISRIDDWDWSGIDLGKESQGITKDKDSIQNKVIETLKLQDFDIIYDDDGSGEVADVVTMKHNKETSTVTINFYHCKYSSKDFAGLRVKDLYEVCGQAQKSERWMRDPKKLFARLQKHERDIGPSRFEKGIPDDLLVFKRLIKVCNVNFNVYIIQPGLSKSAISSTNRNKEQILILLGVTEIYLMETAAAPFWVISGK